MVVDPTTEELAHWICKETQNNKKHAKHNSLFIVICNRLKGSTGLDLEAGQSSDIGLIELKPLASMLFMKG